MACSRCRDAREMLFRCDEADMQHARHGSPTRVSPVPLDGSCPVGAHHHLFATGSLQRSVFVIFRRTTGGAFLICCDHCCLTAASLSTNTSASRPPPLRRHLGLNAYSTPATRFPQTAIASYTKRISVFSYSHLFVSHFIIFSGPTWCGARFCPRQSGSHSFHFTMSLEISSNGSATSSCTRQKRRC